MRTSLLILWNYIVELKQKLKYNYFITLNVNKETKTFCKTFRSYFFDKHGRRDASVISIEKNELTLNDTETATSFNDYFAGIVPFLNLFKWPGNVTFLVKLI